MQDKTNLIMVAVGVIVILLLAAGAFVLFSDNEADTSSETPTQPQSEMIANSGDLTTRETGNDAAGGSTLALTAAELAEFDGRNGNPCYVAVYGSIYEIADSSRWVDGTHSGTSGTVTCGNELTADMESSPHGTSYLEGAVMQEIGLFIPE